MEKNKMQGESTARQMFLDKFSKAKDASISVVFVPTKEPFEVVETLKAYSIAKSMPYFNWSFTKGWCKTLANTSDSRVERIKGSNDPLQALAMLEPENVDRLNVGDIGSKCESIYVMMWTHHFFKNPLMIQYLADYASSFTENGKNLIIIIPENFDIPTEIKEMIYVLDYALPKKEELFLEHQPFHA